MDWSKGYSTKYILSVVDPITWNDVEIKDIISAKISNDNTSALVQSASIEMDRIIGDGENYIRLYLLAEQNDDAAKVAIFTGITSTPECKINGNTYKYDVVAYSVLKPAADVILPRGYYIPAGSNANKIKDLLSVCNAPVICDEFSPTIMNDIVADDGDTNLDMANELLKTIGWRIRILGDGTIHICKKAEFESESFGVDRNDCIEAASITDKFDWYQCPNCFMAISDENGTAVARDDDIESVLSTINRGREIWMCDKNVTLSSDENITEYARRRLQEEQYPVRTLSYNRRFFENIYSTDIVRINYPEQGMTGLFLIMKQDLKLGYNCTVSEEVVSIG